jgi:hypothetical protein
MDGSPGAADLAPGLLLACRPADTQGLFPRLPYFLDAAGSVEPNYRSRIAGTGNFDCSLELLTVHPRHRHQLS